MGIFPTITIRHVLKKRDTSFSSLFVTHGNCGENKLRSKIPTVRYFRYFCCIRYFSVFVIPTKVPVSVFKNIAISGRYRYYRPRHRLFGKVCLVRLQCCLPMQMHCRLLPNIVRIISEILHRSLHGRTSILYEFYLP